MATQQERQMKILEQLLNLMRLVVRSLDEIDEHIVSMRQAVVDSTAETTVGDHEPKDGPLFWPGKNVVVIDRHSAFFGWRGVILEVRNQNSIAVGFAGVASEMLFEPRYLVVEYDESKQESIAPEGKLVPLKFGAGGPTIGVANVKNESGGMEISATINDPSFYKILRPANDSFSIYEESSKHCAKTNEEDRADGA